jgi:hypothetical protein
VHPKLRLQRGDILVEEIVAEILADRGGRLRLLLGLRGGATDTEVTLITARLGSSLPVVTVTDPSGPEKAALSIAGETFPAGSLPRLSPCAVSTVSANSLPIASRLAPPFTRSASAFACSSSFLATAFFFQASRNLSRTSTSGRSCSAVTSLPRPQEAVLLDRQRAFRSMSREAAASSADRREGLRACRRPLPR